MRPRADSARIVALPAEERVADSIGAHAEAGLFCQRREPRARLHIARREDDPRHGLRRLGETRVLCRRAIGQSRELVKLSHQALGVDGDIYHHQRSVSTNDQNS
jgi:hypothetical protein